MSNEQEPEELLPMDEEYAALERDADLRDRWLY